MNSFFVGILYAGIHDHRVGEVGQQIDLLVFPVFGITEIDRVLPPENATPHLSTLFV